MGGSPASSRAYLVKRRLIDSFELYILVYILSMPMLLISNMTYCKDSRVESFSKGAPKIIRGSDFNTFFSIRACLLYMSVLFFIFYYGCITPQLMGTCRKMQNQCMFSQQTWLATVVGPPLITLLSHRPHRRFAI